MKPFPNGIYSTKDLICWDYIHALEVNIIFILYLDEIKKVSVLVVPDISRRLIFIRFVKPQHCQATDFIGGVAPGK